MLLPDNFLKHLLYWAVLHPHLTQIILIHKRVCSNTLFAFFFFFWCFCYCLNFMLNFEALKHKYGTGISCQCWCVLFPSGILSVYFKMGLKCSKHSCICVFLLLVCKGLLVCWFAIANQCLQTMERNYNRLPTIVFKQGCSCFSK